MGLVLASFQEAFGRLSFPCIIITRCAREQFQVNLFSLILVSVSKVKLRAIWGASDDATMTLHNNKRAKKTFLRVFFFVLHFPSLSFSSAQFIVPLTKPLVLPSKPIKGRDKKMIFCLLSLVPFFFISPHAEQKGFSIYFFLFLLFSNRCVQKNEL